MELTEDKIFNMGQRELLSEEVILSLYDIADPTERERRIVNFKVRAQELKLEKELNRLLRTHDQAERQLQKKSVAKTRNMTNFSFQVAALDCGDWIADDYGVRKLDSADRGIYTVASSIPILPSALFENVNTGVEKIQLDFLKGGRVRSVICDRSTAASNNKIVSLADQGVEVTTENAKALVRYISEVVTNNIDILPKYRSVSSLGWVSHNEFMPYHSDVKFDGLEDNRQLFLAITQKGDYDEWKRIVVELRKNLYLRLCMAASFASPLIERVGALPFVFHLWGGTGSGKTVALMVAMSIWGDPSMGKLVRTMNMTANSMMSTAACLNSFPFAGDELQTIKTKWDSYDQLIMKITEGIDRGRMKYNKTEPMKTWNCSFTFTGEEPCTKRSSGGGVVNRVIEVECDQPIVTDGNRIVNFIKNNFGYAGIAYIDAIKDVDLLPLYNAFVVSLVERFNATEKQASSAALLLLADCMAEEYIFHSGTILDAEDISRFLSTPDEVSSANRAYSYITDWVAKNHGKFIESTGNIESWGRLDVDHVLIIKSVLEGALNEAGFDFEAVKREWEKSEVIARSQERFAVKTRIQGVPTWCVKLKLQ